MESNNNIEVIVNPEKYLGNKEIIRWADHDYLLKKLGFNGCVACDDCSCCKTFYNTGPYVKSHEKESVISAVEDLGRRYRHIMGIINKDGFIPTKGGKSFKICQLLSDDNDCLINESKPERCREFPLWVDLSDDYKIIMITFDTSCRPYCKDIFKNMEKLEGSTIDGRLISIGYQNSIELRCAYYEGDEL